MKKLFILTVAFAVFLTSCQPVEPIGKSNISSNSSTKISESEVSVTSGESGVESSLTESSEGNKNSVASASKQSTAGSSSVAASSNGGFDWGNAGGSKLLLQYPSHGSIVFSSSPTFRWSDIKAKSYTLYLEIKSGSSFAQVKKVTGITANTYKLDVSLKSSSTYRWRVEGNKDGKTIVHYASDEKGAVFMSKIDPKTHPANIGKNFKFDGSISEEVLKNYLSRSITLSFISSPSEAPESDKKLIINAGAKYISRSIIPWMPETDYVNSIAGYKKVIDEMHAMDPDIVFETCIFETVWTNCKDVAIPSWVFKAFNLPVQTRNFNYNKMLFLDGKYVNHWEAGCSVPDITQVETQMYFYYRACRYIDAGFEAIHWGQVMLIGSNDTGYKNYSKVLTMVRQYAKTHARRHFILNNAHVHGMTGPDGVLLFDFHAFPIRGKIAAGETEHAPSVNNPQKVFLEVGNLDSIYKKSLGGKTVSGWTCSSLPYVVELDNGGGFDQGYLNNPNRPYWIWGMDEISWFANQPSGYRASWLDYAYNWVRNTDPAGFFMMPGSRPAYLQNLNSMGWYFANSKETSSFGWGDEESIKSVWTKNNK